MDLQMIAYLAELGKLHFTKEEMEQMASEMTSIIEIMDTVKEIDIQYDAYADNKNVYLNDLREDIKEDSFRKDSAKCCKRRKLFRCAKGCRIIAISHTRCVRAFRRITIRKGGIRLRTNEENIWILRNKPLENCVRCWTAKKFLHRN